MLKRILAILMVVALLGTAFVNVVFGATGDTWPGNDLNRSYSLNLQFSNSVTVAMGSSISRSLGVPVFFQSNSTTVTFNTVSVSFTIDEPSTVWIGAYNNAGSWYPDPNYDVGSLSTYYNQALSYEGSLVYNYRYLVDATYGNLISTTENYSASTYVACFSNVPAGTYTYTYNPSLRYCTSAIFVDAIDNGGSGGDPGDDTSGSVSSGSSGASGAIDIYYPMGSDRIGVWNTLLNAINSYNGSAAQLSSILNSIDDLARWGDLLGVSMAEYALSLFSERGALVSGVVDTFISYAEDVLESYTNNELTVAESAVELSDFFSTQLENCGTVSEAMLLGSVYTAWNQKLLILALFGLGNVVLEEGIPDSDEEFAQDYYDREKEMLALFNNQQFSASIDLKNYVNSLNSSSVGTFKSWLDYLINDSFFNPFISIPLSLILVSVVLGTRIVFRRSSSGGGSDG